MTRTLLTVISIVGIVLVTGFTEPQAQERWTADRQTFDYEILREGVPVGSHQVELQRRGGHTRVISRSSIEIGMLGLTFYSFSYRSEEEWDDFGLLSLAVSVDDDGERMDLHGERKNGRFLWRKNEADLTTQEMPLYPTSHWNPSVLSQTKVLNTLTGQVNRVAIEADRTGSIGQAEVKRFRYEGDLQLDAWYDASGRWLGMRFKGRDDSTLEYRCLDCPAWWTL